MEVHGREFSMTSVDFVFDLDSLHGIAYTDMSLRVNRKDMQVAFEEASRTNATLIRLTCSLDKIKRSGCDHVTVVRLYLKHVIALHPSI